jgi:hypothetical protein
MRAQGRIAEDEIEAAALRFNNVIVSHGFLLVAVK